MTPSSNRTSLARNRWQESRVQWVAVLPSLIHCSAGGAPLVVKMDNGSVRPGQGGHDEAHSGEQFTEMMFDFGDHAPRSVPGGGLVLEAAVADQRRVARSAARPRQQILDLPFQHVIGW